MENNCFFGTVLRTLGFAVCSVGARVSDEVNGMAGGGYSAWYLPLIKPFFEQIH